MTWFDIYVLTKRRDRETILWFVEQYANQVTLSEIVRGADLLLLPEGAKSFDDLVEGDLLAVKVADLDELIELGVGDVRRCFWIYLDPATESHKSTIIKFTSDGAVVFGLAIEAFKDHEDGKSNYEEAVQLRQKMKVEFESELETIQCCLPPPDNREDMLLMIRENEINE